jgi:peptide/nickel transport system substrate-binding protein
MGVEESTIGETTDRLVSVTAADERTVVFEFAAPYPSFEGEAGGLEIYPASAMNDPDAYFANPTVTSGQYTIAENWAANRLVLEANRNYWGPPPAITQVTLMVIEDANSALSQLQAGQINYAGDLAPNFITEIADDPNLRIEASPVFGIFDLRLQNASGPMADANVRRAVNAALDREAIVSSIWGDFNEPLSGFWPPEMPGHDPDKSIEQDLDAAREFLVGTECESGCTVDMMYSDQDFAFSSQLALMVQNQLAEIGIEVELQRLDASTLVDRLFAAEYDISPGAMPSDGNFPDPLLNRALLGTGFLMAEFTGYNSEEMNALIEIVNTTTGPERDQALDDIEALFAADQPYVTIAPWIRLSATTLPEGTFQLVGPQALMLPAG